MAEFPYNNAKNVSTGHIFFKFNSEYYPYICFEDNTDPQ